MLELVRNVVLIAATATTGLGIGALYTFAHTVMPGLARTDDRTLVRAFVAMDRAIMNPWFLGCFVGAPLLTALAVALHLPAGQRAVLPWTVVALLLQLVVVVITGRVNIPLNQQLAADAGGDPAAARGRFEAAWVRGNLIRTVAGVLAFLCLICALVFA
jgi:uncharacterized membrane protein